MTRRETRRQAGMGAKRAMDLVFGGVLLVVCLPLMAVVALVMLIAEGRPVFFRQVRPGLHGEPFTILKFRTMRQLAPGERPGADSDGRRMTRVGSFLRATSLDELPELFNVMKGEMSLVGPRPLLMEYLPRYSPEQARRHEVPPGVTGWTQVNGRNDLSWSEKFALDVWYVDNRSLRLDFEILLRTLLAVITRRGVSRSGHATTPYFIPSAEDQPRG